MKYFYSAGAMNLGEGYTWHKLFNFPKFPYVTKTLTRFPKKGYKYLLLPVLPIKSVFNKICLDNIGIVAFFKKCPTSKINRTISIAGTDEEIKQMVNLIEFFPKNTDIELNYSCPNVKSYKNRIIPKTNKNLYLKLNYKQDPYDYDLDKIKSIRVNSIPLKFCGASGKIAQKKNWRFIEKFNKEGLNVSGCSALNFDDIKRLENIGCTEIGLGSVMLINPRFIEKLK